MEKKNVKKDAVCYLIFDVSGSVGDDKKKVYEELYAQYKDSYRELVVISHTTNGKITTIEEVLKNRVTGGTYISSGLLVAMQEIEKKKYYNYAYNYKENHIVFINDGDNWSEDDERLARMIESLVEIYQVNPKDINFFEVYPTPYTTPISKKLMKLFKHPKSFEYMFTTIDKKEKKMNVSLEFVGRKTYATITNEFGTICGKSEARCNPDDKYDRNEGIRIATLRALGIDPFKKEEESDEIELNVSILRNSDSKTLLELSSCINEILKQRVK